MALTMAQAPAAVTASPVLVIDDLVKQFATADGTITAVDHVSFTVRDGEFLSVLRQAVADVDAGKVAVVDVRVEAGYDPAMASAMVRAAPKE